MSASKNTIALMQSLPGPFPTAHVPAYRFKSLAEFFDLFVLFLIIPGCHHGQAVSNHV